MMSNKDNFETVSEGWLTKSPPTTRIWRARWRRRWFILRHSGELPGQYFLFYYTDRNCRKLKGQIDLDQCEQVDAGLRFESRKQKYQHMFTIRTPKRIYYLAAETEEDMNKWVDCVCHVCGLKPFITEEVVTDGQEYYGDGDNVSQAPTGVTDLSPPVTPSSNNIITGPYIPISECISGKPIHSAEDLKQFLLLHGHVNKPAAAATSIPVTEHRPDSYDLPRSLRPPEIQVEVGSTPPPSPGSESVFTDDESARKPHMAKKPTVNWETFPRPSDSSIDGEESPGLGTAAVTVKADRKFAKVAGPVPMAAAAPPRPPKPSHLANVDTTGVSAGTESGHPPVPEPTQDDMYDIPRSHQIPADLDVSKKVAGRHCYTNAAPGHVTENNIFRYDFAMTVTNSDDLPESPRSESGSVSFPNTLAYSNLPSPSFSTGNQIIPTPPAVNRELKPGRKCSDSTGGSNEPSPIPLSTYPPNIDRKLKPLKKVQDAMRHYENNSSGTLKLCSPPIGSLSRRKQRAGPSPTPPSNSSKSYDSGSATTGRMHRRHSSSDDRLDQDREEVQFYQINNHTYHTRTRGKNDRSKKFSEIQYLDLDLDSSDNANNNSGLVNKSTKNVHSPATATVYKTVDFVRTEAFNRTRIEIEEERSSRLCMAAESAS
ncbi:GRB2-associated-binding protein 1-like [Planococcus citri]|uniref:GRB2-associated-binding protein 1-like n=1 Tax=Planococcus citri TaxID=170843 RepID=UPI0031F96C67